MEGPDTGPKIWRQILALAQISGGRVKLCDLDKGEGFEKDTKCFIQVTGYDQGRRVALAGQANSAES